MSRSHNLFFRLPVKDLEAIVEAFQKEFDQLLEDEFSDDELVEFEKMLDSIAAIYVQPILEELSFEDFYPHPNLEEEQRAFFSEARSSILLENLPFFENNPFQVSYLIKLLEKFDNVLIDRGGVNELTFKNDYLNELSKYKSMEALFSEETTILPPSPKLSIPVDPIDFLVLDVYKELQRLSRENKIFSALEALQGHSEKVKKLFFIVREERLDSAALYQKSGLSPKDFDDYLEKLKFLLKKV